MINSRGERDSLFFYVLEQMQGMVHLCELHTKRILYANRLAQEELELQEGQACCREGSPHAQACGCRSTGQLLAHPEQVIHDAWYNPKTLRWYERHAAPGACRWALGPPGAVLCCEHPERFGGGAYWRLILSPSAMG